MWDCNCLSRWRFIHKHPSDRLLPDPDPDRDAVCFNCISFSAIARMLASWLNHCRIRYLILILCIPFLIPLFFATCPLICAVQIFCFFFCRKRRRGKVARRGEDEDDGGLLQRYLEDQLLLVIGSVEGDAMEEEKERGQEEEEEDEDGVNVRYFDSGSPLLQ